jgi:hypothetical protein
MVGKLVRVGLREWLKQHYIERLERMSWMWRKDYKEDSVAIIVVDKLYRNMRFIAIKDK